MNDRNDDVISELSEAEWRVVVLLAAGFDTKGAARKLGVSPHTVRNQVAAAMVKMGVHSRTALVAKAMVMQELTLTWPPKRRMPDPG